MNSLYTELSDLDLFALLKKGNKDSYEEIYNRYKILIYLHAYKMLQDEEEAKDMVQELFANLWSQRAELKIESSLSGYLYKAVRNRVLDRIARAKVEQRYIESLQNFAQTQTYFTDHLVREKELKALIEKEIATLPTKMRLVFELSRKEHLSHREIADKLQISEATVKKQINNALKVLRVRLGAFTFLAFFSDFLQ